MMNTTIKILGVITLMLVAVSNLFAGAPPPPPPPPLGIPIDGGAVVLLAAGAAAGGKMLYQKHKAKKHVEETND